MNGSASNARLRKERAQSAPQVAPVTRAIRSALAVSAAALALSAPVAGMAAGTCSYDTASHAYACNGGFKHIISTQIIPDENFVPPVDLTVVPGDQWPTSVDSEATGFGAAWNGIAPFFSLSGDIDTSGVVEASDASRVDDVTLVGGGDAFAGDAASGIHHLITANAFSISGDISIVATAVNALAAIENDTDISVSGYGNVFGLDIFDGYSASLDNSANISAEASVGAGYFGTGAYATAVRINSMETVVTNDGGISASASADGYYARARGVDAFGYSVGPTVHNAGDIQASAQAVGGVARATGIYSFGYAAGSTVENTGDILAIAHADGGSAYASTINSIAYGYSGGRDASVTNSGVLSAEADADFAVALTVFNLARGRYGNAYTANADDGKIYAQATGDYTIAEAVNNGAARYGNAVTSNAGGVYATANGTSGARAVGIVNYSTGSLATVDNDGSVSAVGTSTAGRGFAIGIQNASELYDASTYNAGNISVRADGSAGASAAGALSTAGKSSYVLNEIDGDIDVVASSQSGVALGFGAYVSAPEVATLLNYGDIFTQASGVGGIAYAYGAIVLGGYAGIGLLTNAGNINADASAMGGGAAFATGAYVTSEVATIFNDGSTAVTASSDGDGGMAVAMGARIYGVNSAINNYGNLTAGASTDGYGSIATAAGAYSIGLLDSFVHNSNNIHASANAMGAEASAIGAGSIGYYFSSYTSNTETGTIVAEASGDHATATGLLNVSVLYGDAVTTNEGSVSALADGVLSATAIGSYNFASYTASVHNSGSITASADSDSGYAIAYGVNNVSSQLSYLTNETGGVVDAVANVQHGYALAMGAYVSAGNLANLTSYGAISASSSSVDGDATAYGALVNGGYAGVGLLINGGDLSADASATGIARATGAFVYADVATIFNDASAAATATTVDGQAIATGAGVYGSNSAINNYGDLTASASADAGIAIAIGADTFGYTGASFYNAGDVEANAFADTGVVSATGASSIGIFIGYATNTGTVSAEATGGQAIARGLYNASAFDAITVNEGSISAVADGALAAYGEYEAVAFGAYNLAVYYNSVIDNSGSISASASATTDISGTDGFLVAKALGAVAASLYGYGEATITNSGSITASAETSQGYAGSWGAVSLSGVYGSASIWNEGSISTYSNTDIGSADTTGAYVRSIAGNSSVVNYGDISANARSERGIVNVSVNYSDATGVQVLAPYGDGEATLANHARIEANASVLGGIGYATGVQAYASNTSIHNAADASITATVDAELFGGAFALGVEAGGLYGVDVVNDGTITAYGHANAFSEGTNGFYGAAGAGGIVVNASIQGDAMVVNNGDVNAIAIAENSVRWAQGGAGATGIYAYAKYDAAIVNAGDVTAIADAEFGNVGAYGVIARGKYSSHVVNEAGASIVALASVGSLYGDDVSGRATSFGTQTFRGGMEYAVTYNAGSIVSHAVVSPDGSELPIGSIATAFGSSIGYNSGIARATVDNRGSIEAAAGADFGYATAYGAFVRSQDESVITNTGDIRASTSAAGGNAWTVGSYAYSLHRTVSYNCDYYGCDWANPIVEVDGGSALIDNSGNVIAAANALGGVGNSYGAVALGAVTAGITNAGHISAVTDADDALAVGALANSFYGDATLQNSGVIGSKATGDIASASGVVVRGVYGVQVDNTGSIVAAAYGPAAMATGASLESDGTHALANAGTLGAIAEGDDVLAMGVQAHGFQTSLALQNTGTVSASATGTTAADAYGALLSGTGSLQVDNAGSIVATADGANAFATALSMEAYGTTTLTNTGTIAAMGDGSRVAIASGASASLAIANSGSIIGAITSGDLDDRFDNAAGANWLAVGTSNFGAGNDLIANHGTIAMDEAEVRLGAGSNAFDNFGTIIVSGDNRIDMAQPFRNNGVIEFRDGAPDDVLTVAGDFVGEGAINLDVSALHGTSDHLYVGGVVNGLTTQTVNVDLGSLPGTPTVDIPLAFVGGNIEAGKFALGNVRYVPYDFLTVDFSLKSQAGATAAAQDVLSLGIEVTGLNDTGSTATALAPGAQSLLNAQIGTWRQRMGVVPQKGGDVGVAPWVRYFSQSGDVDPSHGGNFGMGGDFGFHQSSYGWELGVDTRIGEQFAVGVLLAQSEGNQRLTDGAGSDRLDGDGYGVYGTWMANAFYVDASMRWLDIDARLRYPAGELKADASATAFNVEAGFTGWSLSGINLVPQVQYTHTDVDDFSPLVAEQATFVHHGGTSSLGRLGMAFDKSFDASNWVLTPYGSLNAIREFDGEFDYTVNGGVHGNTSTKGSSAMVELGLGARTGGLSITGGTNWTDGGAMQSVTGAQLVVRYDW